MLLVETAAQAAAAASSRPAVRAPAAAAAEPAVRAARAVATRGMEASLEEATATAVAEAVAAKEGERAEE